LGLSHNEVGYHIIYDQEFLAFTPWHELSTAQAVSLHIPLNPAADSERIRPPVGAPRRRASVVCPQWPTSVCFG
jgi:hypothetical protein